MNRQEIIQNIVDKFREMSLEAVIFHQTLADELGLYVTDHKCMDIIRRFGAIAGWKTRRDDRPNYRCNNWDD
jgi:hypothetical protein